MELAACRVAMSDAMQIRRGAYRRGLQGQISQPAVPRKGLQPCRLVRTGILNGGPLSALEARPPAEAAGEILE